MNAPPRAIETRVDSSKRANFPPKEVLAKVDAAFLKLLQEKGIKYERFGTQKEFGTYSKKLEFRDIFDLYRDSSNEEYVIMDVFRKEVYPHVPDHSRALYIGSKYGVHPRCLSAHFNEVVVMDKIPGPDEGSLLQRLKRQISGNPDYAPGSFSVMKVSHSLYFEENANWPEFFEVLSRLGKPGALQHIIMHRGAGQTEEVANRFGGSMKDAFNVAGIPVMLASALGADAGPVSHIKAQVMVSGVELEAMLYKVGFLLDGTGAIVARGELEPFVQTELLRPDGLFGIGRDDEHFIGRNP